MENLIKSKVTISDLQNCIITQKIFFKIFSYLKLVIIICFFYNVSYSQVVTHYFTSKEGVNRIVNDNTVKNPKIIYIQKPDIQAILKEDNKKDNPFDRFAIKMPTNITEKDGKYFHLANILIWKIFIVSEGATSLNFKFSNLKLPPKA